MSRKFAYKLLFYCLFILYLVGDLHLWHGFFAGIVDKSIKETMSAEIAGTEVVAIVYGVPVTQKQIDRRVSEIAFLKGVKTEPDGKVNGDQLGALRTSAKLELLHNEILRTKSRYNDMSLPDTQNEASIEVGRLASRFNEAHSNSFSTHLLSQGSDVEQFTNMVAGRFKQYHLLNKVLGGDSPSEENLKAYYEELKHHLLIPAHRPLKHVFFSFLDHGGNEAEKLADKVLSEVKNGSDFAMVAKKYSEDGNTSLKGGDLGLVSKGRKEILKGVELFDLPADEPVVKKSSIGWHVFLAGPIIHERPLSYREAEPLIRSAVVDALGRDRKVTVYSSEILKEVRRNKHIWEKN